MLISLYPKKIQLNPRNTRHLEILRKGEGKAKAKLRLIVLRLSGKKVQKKAEMEYYKCKELATLLENELNLR